MKFYLVRKPTQEIVGPLTSKDILAAYSKMQITTSDEVCGNLGVWVFLHTEDKLAEIYPELHNELFKNINSLASTDSEFDPENAETIAKKEEAKSKKKLVPVRLMVGRKLEILFICSFLTLAGILYYNMKIKRKTNTNTPAPPNGELVDLYRETVSRYGVGWANASSFVSEKQSLFLETMASDQSSWDKLIPYVRLNAYIQGGGIFGNLSALELQGREISLPCQISDWVRLIKEQEKLMGRFSLKNPLYKYLLIDANWLQSRWNEGWILPQNLEAACLLLGEMAWEKSYAESAAKKEFEPIRRRFAHYKQKILGNSSSVVLTNHPLDILSCIENSADLTASKICLSKNKTSELKTYFDIVANVNAVRRGKLISGDLPASYPITNFILEPEKRLLQELKAGKDSEDALKTIQEFFPEFSNLQ